MPPIVRYLVTPRVMRRSLLTALFVGCLLFVINQGAAAWRGPWTAARLAQLGLTFLVPFLVSLTSAALTRWELRPGERAPVGGTHVCLTCATAERHEATEVEAASVLPACPHCQAAGRWTPAATKRR